MPQDHTEDNIEGKSAILADLDSILSEIINENFRDTKTLALVFQLMNNLVAGSNHQMKFLNETCLIDTVSKLANAQLNQDQLSLSLMQITSNLIRNFVLDKTPAKLILLFSYHIKLSFIGTPESDYREIYEQLNCLEVLAQKKIDHILKFASKQVIAKLCGLLKSKNSDIFMKAAKVLSMFFSSDQFPDVINNAILEGVFPGMLQLLYTALDSESLGIILFGLSNITGGHYQHVTAFLEEEELV